MKSKKIKNKNMKTRYFILGAAVCGTMGLGLTSCNNDEYLDVTHYSLLSSDALYENDANAMDVGAWIVIMGEEILRRNEVGQHRLMEITWH